MSKRSAKGRLFFGMNESQCSKILLLQRVKAGLTTPFRRKGGSMK
jgi:hypothetical protein